MASRVFTSWIAELGTSVPEIASEITFEIATKDSVDSLPPGSVSMENYGLSRRQTHLSGLQRFLT